MRARRATFQASATAPSGFPPPDAPEIAFAGRSNVGKSTLINALTGTAGLARTSNTPGRTRLINWFHVETPAGRPIAFVDLPGYGYAKVSREMRAAWRPLVEAYLKRSDVLRAVCVLVDARRGAEAEELELLDWLGAAGTPALVVVTKADKLSKSKRKPAAEALRRDLGLARPPLLVAATRGDGVDDLWRAISKMVAK